MDSLEHHDISLNQRMGINLSTAIKRDGVNIIQMPIQSVVNKRITCNLVEALRVIDSIKDDEDKRLIAKETQKSLLLTEGNNSPVKECMRYLAGKELSFKAVGEMMKKEYAKEIVEQSESQTEAAGKLQIHKTYLSSIINGKRR